VPTIFNLIGPLANPGRPRFQVLGVSTPALAEKMVRVLAGNGAERALVVYGDDGLDEITITTTSTVFEYSDGDVRSYKVDPEALGVQTAPIDAVRGGDAAANADLTQRVLSGQRGAHRDIVLLNAAAGLVAAGVAEDLAAGLEQSAVSVDSGAAAGVLERLVTVSKAAAG
jgi:anthranilate phosphoribosyltransferase